MFPCLSLLFLVSLSWRLAIREGLSFPFFCQGSFIYSSIAQCIFPAFPDLLVFLCHLAILSLFHVFFPSFLDVIFCCFLSVLFLHIFLCDEEDRLLCYFLFSVFVFVFLFPGEQSDGAGSSFLVHCSLPYVLMCSCLSSIC